jgi:hypothetical protein
VCDLLYWISLATRGVRYTPTARLARPVTLAAGRSSSIIGEKSKDCDILPVPDAFAYKSSDATGSEAWSEVEWILKEKWATRSAFKPRKARAQASSARSFSSAPSSVACSHDANVGASDRGGRNAATLECSRDCCVRSAQGVSPSVREICSHDGVEPEGRMDSRDRKTDEDRDTAREKAMKLKHRSCDDSN